MPDYLILKRTDPSHPQVLVQVEVVAGDDHQNALDTYLSGVDGGSRFGEYVVAQLDSTKQLEAQPTVNLVETQIDTPGQSYPAS